MGAIGRPSSVRAMVGTLSSVAMPIARVSVGAAQVSPLLQGEAPAAMLAPGAPLSGFAASPVAQGDFPAAPGAPPAAAGSACRRGGSAGRVAFAPPSAGGEQGRASAAALSEVAALREEIARLKAQNMELNLPPNHEAERDLEILRGRLADLTRLNNQLLNSKHGLRVMDLTALRGEHAPMPPRRSTVIQKCLDVDEFDDVLESRKTQIVDLTAFRGSAG